MIKRLVAAGGPFSSCGATTCSLGVDRVLHLCFTHTQIGLKFTTVHKSNKQVVSLIFVLSCEDLAPGCSTPTRAGRHLAGNNNLYTFVSTARTQSHSQATFKTAMSDVRRLSAKGKCLLRPSSISLCPSCRQGSTSLTPLPLPHSSLLDPHSLHSHSHGLYPMLFNFLCSTYSESYTQTHRRGWRTDHRY